MASPWVGVVGDSHFPNFSWDVLEVKTLLFIPCFTPFLEKELGQPHEVSGLI